MATRKLGKPEYGSYFDVLNKQLGVTTAEVEVAGLDIGDQIEAKWLPLTGLVYDAKDDLFQIILGDVIEHLVHHPREIYVQEAEGGLQSLEIVDHDDIKHIVRLKKALALPGPG